jgi:hypothetical protein
MKVIKLILFLEINTLALLIVPCLADSLPYFCKDMDLCLAYNMEEGTMESIQIEYLNLINLMYASRNMEKFLEENAHAPDGSHRTQPILTRETMTYTLSFSISCVCLHANNNLLKGRASAAYERAMSDSNARPMTCGPHSSGTSSSTSRSSPTLNLKVLHRQSQR